MYFIFKTMNTYNYTSHKQYFNTREKNCFCDNITYIVTNLKYGTPLISE